MVLTYAGVKFKTYSGLPFSYEIKKGRNGEYTKELWIDRREKSKSLAWSSIVLALKNIKGEVVDRPESSGRYPGSDLHIRNVLSVRTDRCAGQGKGEDGPSKRPQLKVIKRIMYGRNSFELLKAKVLLHEQFRCEIN